MNSGPFMNKRWTRFEDAALQSRLVRKATQLGAPFSPAPDGGIWYDDEEWCRYGDPQLLTLDDEFGPEWVAVYAHDPKQCLERVEFLRERGVRYVIWSDSYNGASIVLERSACPADWDYA